MRKRIAVICALMCCGGCQAQEQDQTNKKLSGIAVSKPEGDLVVFLGYDADLRAELQESLQGIEQEKTWYRIHIASALAPSEVQTKATWDLANIPGIQIYYRNLWRELALPIDRAGYSTLHFTSKTAELKGTLELASPSAVAQAKGIDPRGNEWGLSYRILYSGPVTMFGETFPMELDSTVGALFVHEQLGGAQ